MLGPIEAREEERALVLGGPKQRALLAILLLSRNERVSRDRLIDDLWGERPPPSAGHTLDDYVSRLRKALGADRIVRRSGGYLLRVEPEELDLDRFERLAREGREHLASGEPRRAAAVLAEALALWRDTPLSEIPDSPFAAREASRLEEQRLAVLEDRLEADLACGGGPELVAALETLVAEHPLRERLIGALMLALYRAGRQAAALEVFARARRHFSGELGIEPGPQLAQLQRQILSHDTSLSGSRRRRPAARRRSRRWLIVAVALAITAAGTAAILALLTNAPPRTSSGASTERLLRLDARSGRVESTSPLPGATASIAVGGRSLWVADTTEEELLRADAGTGATTDRVPLGTQPGEIALTKSSVWVSSATAPTVTRIDIATDQVRQTLHLGGAASALAFADGSLWIGDAADNALLQVDPGSGNVVQTISIGTEPAAIASRGPTLWVAGYDSGTVVAVDTRSHRIVARVQVGQGPSALAFANSSLWVANRLDGTVSRVDPAADRVLETLPTGSGPVAVTAGGTSVWVANEYASTVTRINADSGAISGTIRTGGEPTALTADPRAAKPRLYIATRPATSRPGGTLILLASRRFLSIDPQLENEVPAAEFLGLVNDGLIAYDHSAGPQGSELVPDLALAIPTATDGGRSFTFTLRPGIRYSTGRLVEATDFARGARRLFRVRSPAAAFFDGIEGASSCEDAGRKCRLSGVLADDETRTVTFHLRTPDPDFLFKLALGFVVPVPPGTPTHDVGTHPIPGTGPYKLSTIGAHRIVLTRNPRFREWSHAAQPNGNPDRIEWRFGALPSAEVRAVLRGRADWTGDLPTNLGSLARNHPLQVHSNTFPTVFFVQINTHDPPFTSVRARRALNYAVDRDTVAHMYGALANAPTCQIIPPGLPGYRRYCPYTLDPTPSGRWLAPNLHRAHALTATTDERDKAVTIWDISDTGNAEPLIPYLSRLLQRLGYLPSIHVLTPAHLNRTSPAARARVDLLPVTFGPDYPTPAELYDLFLACHGAYNWHQFCNPRLDREARRAEAERITNPPASARLWASVDRQLVNLAAWIPLTSQRIIDITSRHLRNYTFSPVYHFLPAQAELR